MPNLGDLVRDEVTGFTGVVLARMEALYEATQCRVQSRELSDGGIRAPWWIEEDRLVVLEQNAIVGFRKIAGREIEASNSVEKEEVA